MFKSFEHYIWNVSCNSIDFNIGSQYNVKWNFWLSKKTLLWLFFKGWGSTASRLHSHFEEAVYFLPFSSQKFLVVILSISEGWKAEPTLEPPSGFEHGTPELRIQRLNYVNIMPQKQCVHEMEEADEYINAFDFLNNC